MAQRTWLITGVNSGFGRHMTEQLLTRGDRVLIGYYSERLGQPRLVAHATGDKSRAADASTTVLGAFRTDLAGVSVRA